MAEKGEQNRNKREGRKTGQLSLKEKRKKKKEKELSRDDLFRKIKKTGTQN